MKNPAGHPLATRTTQELCDLIEDGDASYLKVAELWGVSKTMLLGWIEADPDRSARAKLARKAAGDACDRKAEKVLLDLQRGSTAAEVSRARELASHYRWQAKVRNPSRYGDRQQVEHSGTVKTTPKSMTDEEIEQMLRDNAVRREPTES